MTPYTTLILKPQKDYELIDSGEEEKLERYGDIILARPDPQALWKKTNPAAWSQAHGVFTRTTEKASWNMKAGTPESWKITLADLTFVISPTAFKHTGVFPEQAPNWNWIREKITSRTKGSQKVSVLNLFGYTGGATLAAAQAGADVVHVDGSKSAIAWAKDNAAASGLADKPIRWILDDVRKFVAREIKRGSKYDAIIMDPPAFGHGAKKELWKIEEHLPELLSMCRQLLSNNPLFFLVNGYAAGYSAIAYGNNLADIFNTSDTTQGGTIEIGELAIAQSGSERLLPCGIFARWYN